MKNSEKAKEILQKLKTHYPDVECFLNHRNAYELGVATILSAQCTDARVNMVTPVLFKKYPTPQSLANADIDDVKGIIRSTGFYNNKAKSITGFARKIVEEFNGRVPDSMDELLKLPGVARKTANVILSQWYKINEGVTVDTHVRRLSKLLGLSKHDEPIKIEQDLMKLFPKTEWNYISVALIQYGRDFCTARKHDTTKCFLGGH